jgi:F-type H+-transporting ATPase subunit gamma
LISSIDVENKRKAFRTIEDIVSAMKAYAGVTIRKTEEFVQNIRVYEENILHAMSDIVTHYPHISFEQEQRGKRILIAFGSSHGLTGSFNEKIADAVSDTLGSNDTLFITGRRLKSVIESRQIAYEKHIDAPVSANGIKQSLKETFSQITKIYRVEGYYNLTVIFTVVAENRAAILIEKILPPDMERRHTLKPSLVPPLTYFEPLAIFDKVLEEFIYISLYRCFMESLKSENWYRLRSMEGASENLKRRLSDLDSLQNYVRQEEITEEMLEILGGGMFYRKQRDKLKVE